MLTRSGWCGTSQAVDQMVVSVGPYMLTSRRTRERSSTASLGGSGSPPVSAVSGGRSPVSRTRQPEGVAWTWVTCSARTRRLRAAPSRAVSASATTTRPPVTSGR